MSAMLPVDPAASLRPSPIAARPALSASGPVPGESYQGTVVAAPPPPVLEPPRKSWGQKLLSRLASVGRTTIAVAPTLASLVASWAASRIEGVLPGGQKLSAVDWMRTRLPGVFTHSVNALAELAGPAAERAVGLSAKDLVSIDEHLYKMLSPQPDCHGVKRPPRFLRQLAEATFHEGTPDAAYVYLGEGRENDSQAVMDLWNSDKRPDANPYPPEDDRSFVWETLQHKVGKGDFPVFIDLDGDPKTYSSAEFLAKETVASLVERGNSLGAGFSDAGLYYSWLNTRLNSYYGKLEPWMDQKKPEILAEVRTVKQDLTPPWLGGQEGLGPWPSSPRVNRAFDTMKKLAGGDAADFADAAACLDRDLLTGVQTHWIKLMREVGSERRGELFTPLARSWVELNLKHPCACAHDAPVLASLQGDPPATLLRPYDRSVALGEVVDHTLNGLGLAERRQFMDILRDETKRAMPLIEKREIALRQLLGERYAGIDLHDLSGARPGLDQLRELANTGGLDRPVLEQVIRHYDLVDWLATSEKRYGDVDMGLLHGAACFKKNPLAISEYFDPGETPSVVTTLGAGPTRTDVLGHGTGPAKGVSVVLEGGGGKGFCYVECLKQLRQALEGSKGKFAIDEYVGTSAGAITAGVMAAGFSVEELSDILTRLDFKKFNSDAVWLMGGVDPKVRGINRTGLFSQQKMYQSLYQLFSKKLGIEGRPILFRDLPYKLKVMAVALNSTLPENDPLRQAVDGDGRLVMSAETTPNFDVVAAIISSAAVPGFFSAPQMEIARGQQLHRLQLCDGGVVDNLPVSAATPGDRDALVVLPAHYEATDPATGQPVGLSTLNFDPGNIAVLDAHNKANYERFAPQLADFLSDLPHDRVVLALNLATAEEQSVPALLGRSREDTATLNQLAHFPKMEEKAARKLMDRGVTLGKRLSGALFNGLVDGQGNDENRLDWSWKSSRVHLGPGEEEDLYDVVRGAGAAAMATTRGPRNFEA